MGSMIDNAEQESEIDFGGFPMNEPELPIRGSAAATSANG